MFEHVVILETSFLEKPYFPLLPALNSWLGSDFGMIVLAFSSSAFLISSFPFSLSNEKCLRVFLLLPRCQNKFFIFTSCFCVDSCLHCLLAVVRVFSGFLFRSPNWHPSLQDGYVRDKLMHINMQIHLMGVQSLAQCNFSFLSLLWFSSTRNLPSTEHLESSKQILRFPNSLGRFVSKFKPIFHLQLPFPTKQKILLSSKQAAIF